MNRFPKLAASVLVALLLPIPGPHIDRWTPMAAALLNEEARHAPLGFFALASAILIAYSALVFGALSLLRSLVRRRDGDARRH